MAKIVITESVANEILNDNTMSEYRFESNIKRFVAELMKDPSHARPSEFLENNGFDRLGILRMLADEGALTRIERISDTDKDGNFKKATMMVTYKVAKDGKLDKAIEKIYNEHFSKPTEMNEEGAAGGAVGGGACAGGCSGSDGGGSFIGGATSASSNATFDAPAFSPALLKHGKLKVNWLDNKKKKKKKLSESFEHDSIEEKNGTKSDNCLNLPPIESLGDGEYNGALWGHSFAYNGNKYYSKNGIMNIFPIKATVVIKNGECEIKETDSYQRPELKSLFY